MDLQPNKWMMNLLAQCQEEVLYCPNPGNAGDSAIACATHFALEQCGYRYKTIDPSALPSSTSGRIVLYGGGGNLVSYYQNAHHFIKAHHQSAKKFILLPHTIEGHGALLAQLGPNVHLFCRDQPSLDHAKKATTSGAEVSFAHDMVFMLDVDRLLSAKRVEGAPLRHAKRVFRSWRHAILNRSSSRVLFAFRADAEKTHVEVPSSNIDVSQAFAADSMSRNDSIAATQAVLQFLDRFSEVHTNRLHVAILSALLKKRVLLHDNSYGKNRNVYQASMKANFPNVEPAWL